MCYCFTSSGNSGTDAMHRSRTFKSKMEECDGSRFYCSFLLDADAVHDGDFTASSESNKGKKKNGVGRDQELTFCVYGSGSLERGADQDTWSDVKFEVDCGGVTCLLSGRCTQKDARETKHTFKLKPRFNVKWLLCL